MHIIIASSGRDCILIILFRLYGSKAGLFEGSLFWMSQYEPPITFIFEEEELIQYQHAILEKAI